MKRCPAAESKKTVGRSSTLRSRTANGANVASRTKYSQLTQSFQW